MARVISAHKITAQVSELCLEANFVLRPDVLAALRQAYAREKNKIAKAVLEAIIQNARIAKRERLAICQDTGLPIVFAQLGCQVKISGDLNQAINKGIEIGYRKGYLRNSLVRDPVLRQKPSYGPAVIHSDIVPGDKLRICLLPKGFGCENKSQLKMFNPTADIQEVKKFIVEAVKAAGPDACPPYVVGVGIGGTAEHACLVAKKALLRKVTGAQGHKSTSRLEAQILQEINQLNIGPMGLGGRTTALAVNIELAPTHIAGLPVAVNISCHALRSAKAVI